MGITPAHAGKRYISCRLYDASEDHPRTRGEKYLLQSVSQLTLGSPPHTRGKVKALPG